jgi:hypothetical protein
LILPGVSTAIFTMMKKCSDADPNNSRQDDDDNYYISSYSSYSDSYLTTDLSISCDSWEYIYGVLWAFSTMFIYPVVKNRCIYFYIFNKIH